MEGRWSGPKVRKRQKVCGRAAEDGGDGAGTKQQTHRIGKWRLRGTGGGCNGVGGGGGRRKAKTLYSFLHALHLAPDSAILVPEV